MDTEHCCRRTDCCACQHTKITNRVPRRHIHTSFCATISQPVTYTRHRHPSGLLGNSDMHPDIVASSASRRKEITFLLRRPVKT